MDQIIIALTGIFAILLMQDKRESVRKWAPVVGLLGQPFWLWATWHASMDGMFFVSVLYTLVWLKGLLNHWKK
jgi:hypothetical protein